MGAKRVYWTVGLLAVGFLGVGVSVAGDWYMMAADGEDVDNQFDNRNSFFGSNLQDDIDDPRLLIHTGLWHAVHLMDEGGHGRTGDYEVVPFIAQVLGMLRVFWFVGLAGLAIATVGLLFRLRGLIDGKGIIATLAAFSLLFMMFGMVYFSANIAEAYNKQLEADPSFGTSPEIAFFTFGTSTEDGDWKNVTSAPALGWWGGAVGVAAFVGAFGVVFVTDLRRARDVLVDDTAAAERYAETTEARRHVLDRIREGGRS